MKDILHHLGIGVGMTIALLTPGRLGRIVTRLTEFAIFVGWRAALRPSTIRRAIR